MNAVDMMPMTTILILWTSVSVVKPAYATACDLLGEVAADAAVTGQTKFFTEYEIAHMAAGALCWKIFFFTNFFLCGKFYNFQ